MKLKKEYLYYFTLAVLLFVFMFLDEEKREFKTGYLLIALNYSCCAVFISYVLIPVFYAKKRIAGFVICTIAAIIINVVIEELVIEPLFFDVSLNDEFRSIFFSIAHTIPVMAILVGFKFLWDINTKRKQLSQLQQLMAENEMKLLKSQINPHFLFNNLNNIYSYAVEQSPQTPVLIYELSEVLRYMLYDCKEKYVPLSNEVEHLKNYIRLNEIQMETRGTVALKTQGSFDNLWVAPSLLIVFVENAFKHSLSSLTNGVSISISISVRNGELNFVCENNYSANSNTHDISGGIGLSNVKTQLNLIYPGKHELSTTFDENTYTVTLNINLKQND